MRVILIVFMLFGLLSDALAQGVQPPPEKVGNLLRLLQDQEVRNWLERQPTALADVRTPPAHASYIVKWESETRRHINGVIDAIPRIPSEVAAAAARVWEDAVGHSFAPAFVVFTLLMLVAALAEIVFRRRVLKTKQTSAGLKPLEAALYEFVPMLVFAAAMIMVFFAFAWPPLERIALLVSLAAVVSYRLLSTAVLLAMPPTALRARIRLLLGVVVLALACAALGQPLGIPREVQEAISFLFSGILLFLATEAVWTTLRFRRSVKAALTLALVVIWFLWCLGLSGLFWIGIYALILPGALSLVGRLAGSYRPTLPDGRLHEVRRVLIIRGSRAIVLAVAIAWLAVVWRYSPTSLAHQSPAVAGILYGLLKGVAVVLLADLLWNLAKALIDRKFEASSLEAGLSSDELARRSRLRTLLPIFRNGLAAIAVVMTGLIVLSELGVEIAPLIAGAGIFGVALGFGSQTLVKDVISGIFYMLDDAFRVGEYIQSGSYKGTVESFSLRSVRLRHHRGPVFTVPFGALGAVQNMSRDWVIDKFRISVAYDTDINKARKITKAIGAELLADPEVGPLFIEPLKMKGVEEFGDYGIVLGFGMTTVPGQQTYIRRKAYAMIREAFNRNGIEFAQPSVQVGGDDKGGEAAAAATAVRAKSAANPVTTEEGQGE